MRRRIKLVGVGIVGAVLLGVAAGMTVAAASEQETANAPAPVTAWGDPDLQGIWDTPFGSPLQRAPQYGERELFADEERAAIQEARGGGPTRDDRVFGRGNEQDVNGGYNIVFTPGKPLGRFTSLVVDPPDGRIPPMTPEAEERAAIQREFHLALLQATSACEQQLDVCEGGKYGPVSPRYDELPPFYVSQSMRTGALNRAYGPEDMDLRTRCLPSPLPSWSGPIRIVQSKDAIAIFYEGGQGQVWQRVVPITDQPHLPDHVQLWAGDSRARWEDDTLVVDVTNFDPRNIFPSDTQFTNTWGGSRGNLHLVERFRRVDEDTLAFSVTIDDPTTWTQPWTIRNEFVRQDSKSNLIFYEPRCHEGNRGLVTILSGARAEEKAYEDGEGPHPATICISSCGGDR